MRKATASERYMYKNLFWLSICVFLFIPFINNFVLQLIKLSVSGDIAYGSLAAYIQTVQDLLSLFGNYAGLGVLCCVVVYFGKESKSIIRLSLLSHLWVFLVSVSAYSIYNPRLERIFSAAVSLALDMLINLLIYVLIILIAFRISKKVSPKQQFPQIKKIVSVRHPFLLAFLLSACIFGGTQLIFLIYTMIDSFIDPSLGVPINAAEWLYWITEFILIIVNTCIGYMISLAVGYLSVHYMKKRI